VASSYRATNFSVILFDLTMEPAIRAAEECPGPGFPIGDVRITVCAVTDGLALYATTEQHFHLHVESSSKTASTNDKGYRPSKCTVIAGFEK